MDTAQLWALEICGVVFTSKTPAVIVNAFGPIAYCKLLILFQCPLFVPISLLLT